jgi:SAM-dependent methyltransferase
METEEIKTYIEQIRNKANLNLHNLQPWGGYFDRRAREIESLFSVYKLKRVHRILEVGCSNGFISAILSKMADEVISTDLFRPDRLSHSIGITKAKELLRELGIINCKILSCSGEDLPFPERAFDMAFCAFTLEHIPNKAKAIREISRVLKDESKVIFLVPNFMEMVFYPLEYYCGLVKRLLSVFLKKHNHSSTPRDTLTLSKQENDVSLWRRLRMHYPHFPMPEPHGAYKDFFTEFINYLPANWVRLMKENGFNITNLFTTTLIPRLTLFFNSDLLRFYKRYRWIEKRCGKDEFRKIFGQYLCIVAKKRISG